MNFLYPNFLWSLIFIAIPIIIHLFYFKRYKKIYFSNTALLSELKDERSSRNKLKHLLVLFSRIFAIVFFVFAFAQPYFSSKESVSYSKEKYISIYIDNSFSMNTEGKGQLVFDEAKEISKNIINASSENTHINILTNNFEGKHQRFTNKNEALSFLKEIQSSSTYRNYQTVFNRQKNLYKNIKGSKIIYQISDFQKHSSLFKNDTSFNINLIKLVSNVSNNVLVDSVWFDNSFQLKNANNKMIVKFRNEGNESISGNYQLLLNGKNKSIGEYEIKKHSYSLDTLYFKISEKGWNTGKIQLSDYPLSFDDEYYYSFYVEEKVKVLNIVGEEKDVILSAVFKDIKNINYHSINLKKIDYNNLSKFHFIVLDRIKTLPSGLVQEIKKYVANGGSIFIIPHKNSTIENYNVLLSTLNIGKYIHLESNKRKISNFNLKHYVLEDLFEKQPKKIKLPTVKKYFSLQTTNQSNEQNIFSFGNNESYLSSFNYKNGNIFLLNSTIEKSISDISSNVLFAPIIYKMAVLSVNNVRLSFEINANTKISIKNKPETFEEIVKIKNEEIEFIPQKNMFGGSLNLNLLNTNIKEGIYTVFSDKNNELAKIALNYNRTESLLNYYSKEDLENHFIEKNVQLISGSKNNIQENILNNKQGKSLWKWFIVFSLLFLAFEIILLRKLKV